MKRVKVADGRRVRFYCECDGRDWTTDHFNGAEVNAAFNLDIFCKECHMFPWTFSKPKEK